MRVSLVVLFLVTFMPFAVVAGENAFYASLREYASVYLRYGSQKSCIDGARKRKEATLPEKEIHVLDHLIKMCGMNNNELWNMASAYECGCNDLPEDKDIAISIYSHLYYARGQINAAYKLKELGIDVVIDVPSEEEKEKTLKQKQKLIQEIKRRNPDFSLSPE